MKLFKSAFMASAVQGLERGLDPLQSIAFAHSRIRQGFLIPEMDNIIDQNERHCVLKIVFSSKFSRIFIKVFY